MRARAAALAAGVAAACFGAAALLLAPDRSAPPVPVRAVVLDASASLVRRSPGAALALRAVLEREARAAREAGEEVLVVRAARGASRLVGPAPPAELLDRLAGRGGDPLDPLRGADGSATDLAAAVRLVEELVGERPGSLLVVGDGTYTGRDPAPEVERLVRDGFPLAGVEVLERERADAALAELVAPARIEAGAPLAVTASVALSPGRGPAPALELAWTAAGGGERRAGAVPVAAAPGVLATATLELGAFPAGRVAVEVRVRRADGARDPVPENDARLATVSVGGALAVGVVRPRELAAAVDATLAEAPPGLELVPLAPEELAARLPELDGVVTVDVPLDALPEPELASFVRLGGGWLFCGGFRALAGWRPGRLLPLSPSDGDGGPRRVVVLVDGSGSMEGEPFEEVRTAVRELGASAPESDELELRFFTAVLQPPTRLGSGGLREDRAARLARLMEARVPGGQTRIVASLEELARERARSDERALVLLLTDGREARDVVDVERRTDALRGDLAASATELVVVSMGERADEAFLARLAGSAGAVRDGGAALDELFRREVNRERTLEGQRAVVARADPGVEGVVPRGAALPPVERLLATRVRADASVVLATADGHPLLAVAREGRGRVAALAALPLAGWASAYALSGGAVAPVLRFVARAADRGRPSVTIEGDLLVLRGAETAPPVLAGRLGPTTLELCFEPRLGAHVAPLPAAAREARPTLFVPLAAAGEGAREVALPFVWPPGPELALPAPRLALEEAASAAGPPRRAPAPAGEPGPLGRLLLAGGLCAALAAGILELLRGRAAGEPSGRSGIRPSGR